MPKLSVIMPTYNRQSILKYSLESLKNQVFTDFELIIINDGGNPVDEVVNKWGSHINVRIINLTQQSGPAKARNAGIQVSDSKYLSFLDDDDYYLPDHFQNLVTHLDNNECDFIYTGVIISPRRLQTLPEKVDDFIIQNYEFKPDFLHVTCYIPVASIVCRNFSKKHLLFNEQLRMMEDWEMWLRLIHYKQ